MTRWIVLLLLFTSALAGQDDARLQEIVRESVETESFIGAILAAHGDDVLLSEAYGPANLEWGMENTPETRFRLGSITKQFTAAGILLLEERGKLRIDDPVQSLMPDAPDAWDGVTIRHLLTHTSGIPSFTGFPNYQEIKRKPHSPARLVELFRDKPLDFAPGSEFRYSNSGYVLLGFLLEKASGQGYEEFLEENVFGPLEMTNTGYDMHGKVIMRRASGYRRTRDELLNADLIDMSVPFSAGALYSTTGDLLKWTRGLFGGEVLSEESLAKMIEPYKDDYALGVVAHEAHGRKAVSHGGGIEGFATHLIYFPEEEVTVAVLSNQQGRGPQELALRLAAASLGEAVELPSERKEVTVAPEVLARYVGTYSLAPKVDIMIRLEDGQLTSQVSGQVRTPLFAKSETAFFLKVVDASLDFVTGDDGEATHLILHQGGRDREAMRTSKTVEEKQEVAVSPEVLEQYVGVYELQPGFELTVILRAGQLISQATGQREIPLFAQSETVFFPKVMDAEIEFFRGDDGTVTHLVLKQGPAEMKAPRLDDSAGR